MLLPYRDNVLFHILKWNSDSADPDHAQKPVTEIRETTNLDKANVVSSRQRAATFTMNDDFSITDGEHLHTPVLDIDVPAMLVPSSTPGNSHLYFGVPMTWEQYQKLLDVMAEVGILESGYVSASKQRGFTAVRLPWCRKG